MLLVCAGNCKMQFPVRQMSCQFKMLYSDGSPWDRCGESNLLMSVL
jgi:hypothetical protein